MPADKVKDLVDYTGHGAGTKQFKSIVEQAMFAFELAEENAQLKERNEELLKFVESLCPPYIYDEDGNIIHMGGKSTILMGTNYEGHIYQLIQKHKETQHGSN